MANARYTPLVQLTLARLREFYREPAAVFWVYGFPLLMAVALGIAFRERPVEQDHASTSARTSASPAAVAALKEKLAADERLVVNGVTGDEWLKRLRTGKTDLVVARPPTAGTSCGTSRTGSESDPGPARGRRACCNQQAGRPAAPKFDERHLEETGNRYIDFLVPGLLGHEPDGRRAVGRRVRAGRHARPQAAQAVPGHADERRDFLLSIMLSRMMFTVPEVLILLLFAWLVFDVKNQGSLVALVFLIVIGAASFAGLGLLVASRAKTIETVSGLMNLVMLPMWILSGVFFSSERFPEVDAAVHQGAAADGAERRAAGGDAGGEVAGRAAAGSCWCWRCGAWFRS